MSSGIIPQAKYALTQTCMHTHMHTHPSLFEGTDPLSSTTTENNTFCMICLIITFSVALFFDRPANVCAS